MMAKTLVVYFSHKGENYMPGGTQVLEKGNTEYAAEFIQEALGADLFEIDTVKAYSTHYRECCKEAAAEAKTNARPEIKDYLPSLEGYDTLFVCYPNWCGTAPMCIFTFLEHYDLTGKKILPLCTNEGSGLANSVQDLQKYCVGAKVQPGLSVLGHQVKDSKEVITSWAKNSL